ncbi:hypothetical protein HMPREF9420_1718 [Segatella salivae DSM 15606]|uniref:Uncharacterized protein n=1 Tax=Segatella salivae DSM 15606 TaxID=888832 RepID=E6MQF0_9BACT|nr:hypothetical protein HMPREF9420_1718 [Segatella salivae DSM 15606]
MIHVSNIGEIIDIQCKKDVKKVELSYFLFGGMGQTKPYSQPFAFLVSQASRTATYGSPKREGSG